MSAPPAGAAAPVPRAKRVPRRAERGASHRRGRRCQSRGVNPAVRHLAATIDPLGSAPIGIRRSMPTRTASPRTSRGRCRRTWWAVRWPRSRGTPGRLSSSCARWTASSIGFDLAHIFVPKSASGCVITSKPALSTDRSSRPGRSSCWIGLRSRDVRALPPQELRRQDAILDRGSTTMRADPRRADRRFRRGGRHARAHRHAPIAGA